MIKHFSANKSGGVTTTNLDGVTSATNGPKISTRDFKNKSVFVEVPVNTGAVTVTIEASYNGSTWFELDQKVYTATTGSDLYSYTDHFPFMRTTTTTQSNSTVSAEITGES